MSEEATWSAMKKAWGSVGQVSEDVYGHLINPMFMGGPAWPNTRQGFRQIPSGHPHSSGCPVGMRA